MGIKVTKSKFIEKPLSRGAFAVTWIGLLSWLIGIFLISGIFIQTYMPGVMGMVIPQWTMNVAVICLVVSILFYILLTCLLKNTKYLLTLLMPIIPLTIFYIFYPDPPNVIEWVRSILQT